MRHFRAASVLAATTLGSAVVAVAALAVLALDRPDTSGPALAQPASAPAVSPLVQVRMVGPSTVCSSGCRSGTSSVLPAPATAVR